MNDIGKYIFLLVIIITEVCIGQDSILFEFDYARFRYDTVSTYFEIYYSISEEDLKPVETAEAIGVSAVLQVIITDKISNQQLINKKYNVNTTYATFSEAEESGKNLVGMISFLLPFGEYYLELKVQDQNDSARVKYLNEEIISRAYSFEQATISDLEFASRIVTESQNTNSIFYKNTIEVVPNPHNIFGKRLPILFYYAELYNLLSDTTSGDVYINKQVVNSLGEKVFEKTNQVSRQNNSIVDVGALNISKYPTGSYKLMLSLLFQKTNKGVSSSKRFYIINPDVKDTSEEISKSLSVVTSEFGVMSEEDCDELFGSVKYFGSSNEIDQYESLDSLNAKRKFLFNFFIQRDPDPSTPENEFKQEVEERIDIIEGRYRSFTKTGVKTDRGRVYLIYGDPDEIEMHPNDYDRKPYEIWYYHSIEGGVIFVFGDLTGYSDYELLHSTKRGELRDDNWQRRIIAN
ncbi:MAG: GWxTD domain-containing protein [Melioribacteraceae bacterium]|nr:GWxTD domain-containing protein [Melioribacteraceae bacterium]